jgi:hypothetical protein
MAAGRSIASSVCCATEQDLGHRTSFLLIAPAALDNHAPQDNPAALALPVAMYSVVLALAPAHRMRERVPDLRGLSGRPGHVLVSGS